MTARVVRAGRLVWRVIWPPDTAWWGHIAIRITQVAGIIALNKSLYLVGVGAMVLCVVILRLSDTSEEQ